MQMQVRAFAYEYMSKRISTHKLMRFIYKVVVGAPIRAARHTARFGLPALLSHWRHGCYTAAEYRKL